MFNLFIDIGVLDATRHINPFVTKHKVKLDSLECFAFLVKKEDFVAVDDLDLGYWYVPLHPLQSSLFGVAIYDQVERKTLFLPMEGVILRIN